MVGMGTETTQVNLATAVGRHFITRYYQKGLVMEKYRSFPMAHGIGASWKGIAAIY